MSNPAKRRGRGGGRGQPGSNASAPGSPAAYDGPASQGGGASSNPSLGGQRPSAQPSAVSPAGSAAGSPPASPRPSQAQSQGALSTAASPQGTLMRPLADPALDPSRQTRLTDLVRNVDLPASLYNIDNLVRIQAENSFPDLHCDLSSLSFLKFLSGGYSFNASPLHILHVRVYALHHTLPQKSLRCWFIGALVVRYLTMAPTGVGTRMCVLATAHPSCPYFPSPPTALNRARVFVQIQLPVMKGRSSLSRAQDFCSNWELTFLSSMAFLRTSSVARPITPAARRSA